MTTAETRTAVYETTVTWGDGGPQIDAFGLALMFCEEDAVNAHEAMCQSVEVETGIGRALVSDGHPPFAA